MTYYTTVPSGLQDLASEGLREAPIAARILASLDGAVLYKSRTKPGRVAELPFAQNSFLVFRSIPHLETPPMKRLLEKAVQATIPSAALSLPFVRRAESFRLVTSAGNRLVSPDPRLRDRLEASLKRALHKQVARAGADLEFWLIARREGLGIFGLRLTRRRATEKDLSRGELRPELANLLCLLSRPQASDRFLDPFCGYGAIVAERLRSFPAREVYARDVDARRVAETRGRLSGIAGSRGARISVSVGDGTKLDDIETCGIEKLVTDPPWGVYDDRDLADLYTRALAEMSRVLHPGGVAVLLVGRDGPMDGILAADPAFDVDRRYDILVSGRKATVLRAAKSG